MRLTRRGYGLLAVVVAAELMAFGFGARTLNAVAAPGAIALVGAAVQVRRSDRPSVDRSPVSAGFPGDSRRITVEVSGEGVAHIEEEIPDGIGAEGATVEARLPDTFEYTLVFDRRGEYTLGPMTVRVRDVLGLVEETYTPAGKRRVLVYPSVYQLAGEQVLVQRALDISEVERQEFDSLREYVPGDPLRDVHWKSSAKDPETMYVTEFADRQADHDVVVAATADDGHADEMAAAAASLAVAGLDAGLGVELHLPSTSVPMGRDEEHRRTLLAALARTGAGALPEVTWEGADVRIHAHDGGVDVEFGAERHTLDAMTVSRENPLATAHGQEGGADA